MALTWDATTCPADAVNVYHGPLGDFAAFAGGACDLPNTGAATVAVPDDAWFLVVATDGAAVDGSRGTDGSGAERTITGAAAVCPAIETTLPGGECE